MTITPKSVTVGTNNGSSATVSVTTSESPTPTAVGDLVVVTYSNDFYSLASMGTPTATGSPTLTPITGATADGGASSSHVKAFWYLANTAGAQTITATETGTHDEDKTIVAWVLPAGSVDTTTPVSAGGAQGTVNAASTTTQTLTGATAATAGAIALGHLHSSNSASTASYTTGSMTEVAEWHVFTSGVVAYEQLSASGATGSRTITAASATPYVGTIVVIEASAGSTSISLADTGSDVDALAVTAAAPLADTASAAQSLAASAAAPLAETGSASDALAVVVSLAMAETAAALDSLGITAAVPLGQSAAGVEALTVNTGGVILRALADVGQAAEALCVCRLQLRPFSGATGRPSSGATARPDTGRTSNCC